MVRPLAMAILSLAAAQATVLAQSQSPPTGVEKEAPVSTVMAGHPTGALRVIQANLHDQTDHQPEISQQTEWLLYATAPELKIRGNAFAVENALDGTGEVFLRLAPPPDSRGTKSDWDLSVKPSGAVTLNQDGGYPWVRKTYTGGRWGRMVAAHALQRAIRPYDPRRDGLFLTNTWGDRARDAHLNTAFLFKEIAAAKQLGVDVLEIDDGWQEGMTANSAQAPPGGGAWSSFWGAHPTFWNINAKRFPEGLAPVAAEARKEGVRLGLWFAPDSSHEAADWQRDADVLLRLHRDLGVDFFKIDSLNIASAKSEENFHRLFNAVRTGSQGAVTFDFDSTAGHRYGYFGMPEDDLFVENRYTDWGNYLPHQTLRAAWQLAEWVDPMRLRMEWLNGSRNADKYGDNPLAPGRYSPDALFAITMFTSPLGFFETQNLPPNYFTTAGPLIAKWKQHREAIFRGDILPIGYAPDGLNWTGFVSTAADRQSAYALLFRELNASASWSTDIPLLAPRSAKVEVLGGSGTATYQNGLLTAQIPDRLGYIWVRLQPGT
jgi:alpha-galactosidase